MAAGSTTRTSNSDEKSIEITASDPRTGFHVYYDGTFGGDAGNVVAFCGKGKITVSSKTAHEISVRPALDECGGAATSGKLTAVITGMKQRLARARACHSDGMRGPLATLLAATCLLSGCGTVRATEAPPAGSTLTSARPVVPQFGAYRRSGRGEFRSRTTPVSAARLGSSYRAGCPVGPADLRLVQVTHLGPDGRAHQGELVVHRLHAAAMVRVFRALYDARFPVERMRTVERYGGDDDRSMAANNTSAFNCRAVAGGAGWSEHAYGAALDVNPVQNPYVRGSSVEPEAGRAYLDRSRVRPGMVVVDDVVVRAFASVGWEWGGDFRTLKDYQHFSASGR